MVGMDVLKYSFDGVVLTITTLGEPSQSAGEKNIYY